MVWFDKTWYARLEYTKTYLNILDFFKKTDYILDILFDQNLINKSIA